MTMVDYWTIDSFRIKLCQTNYKDIQELIKRLIKMVSKNIISSFDVQFH